MSRVASVALAAPFSGRTSANTCCSALRMQRLVNGFSQPAAHSLRQPVHFQPRRWNQAYAPPPSEGEVLRKYSPWRWLQGTGRPAPHGGGLDTDQYTVFLNCRTTVTLELFHGSTGAIMFRPAALPQEREAGELATKPQVPVRSTPRWLGWDGDMKDQLEGTWDFSAWLAPDVVASLDQDWQDFNQPLQAGNTEFGYWALSVPDRGIPPQGSTCAVITNSKSSIRIVLTTEGFAYETEDGKSLLLVNNPRPLLLPRTSLPEMH